MSSTITRPLPTDETKLRAHWLPPEPDDTAVSAMRAAVARIDQAVAAVLGELAALDQADRRAVEELIDAAAADPGLLELAVGRLDAGDRAGLEHRLAQLRAARSTADYRRTAAQRTDPAYVAWVADCDRIIQAWKEAVYGSADEAGRLAAVVNFADNLSVAP